MIILLPPSEGKAVKGGTGSFADLYADLFPEVQAVLRHASRLKVADRMKFYGMKEKAKAKACHDLNLAAPASPCMQALERYTGVVYQGIDFPTLKKRQQATSRIHIVSGLFGAITGATRIPNYKMSMNPWLVKYWREKNAQRIAAAAGGLPVLSLLSQTYAKAAPVENAIGVDFRVQGGKKAAGHFGKTIKGRFVRFLIDNAITDTKDFSAFTEDGYAFDGANFIQS